MSKLTALLTVLVLGSSAAAAMASPARSYDRRVVEPSLVDRSRIPGYIESTRIRPTPVERAPDRFRRFDDRDRRFDDRDRGGHRGIARDDFGPRRYRPTWTALSAPLRLSRGGQGWIDVDDPGTFTQLRLQAEDGTARIDRVVIQFTDGTDQVAYPSRVLDDRSDLFEIPLDGNNRVIDRILVTGATRGGAVEVFAI